MSKFHPGWKIAYPVLLLIIVGTCLKKHTEVKPQSFSKASSVGVTEVTSIETALAMPVQINCHERPLADVIASVGRQINIPIVLDQLGLDTEGITSETPLTIQLSRRISAYEAFRLILEPLHLGYRPKGTGLVVTTEQHATADPLRRYVEREAAKLCENDGDTKRLIEVMMATINDKSWNMPTGSLLITSEQEIHERAVELVRSLQELLGEDKLVRGASIPGN